MIPILYDSKTGNVKRFIKKLPYSQVYPVNIISEVVSPFILVTYTTGFGRVPETTQKFLEANHKNLVGVAASGNMNWGATFCQSAEMISKRYNVPIIHKFEMSGADSDIRKFIEGAEQLVNNRSKFVD